MKIEIKDLGYVKNVSLDLDKDLTILCGPNNTGKTYVAYAIYGLMRFRSELLQSKKVRDEIKYLTEKGQIEFDILELLTENSSTYLNEISKNYLKQISKVFASEESTFEKTEIILELGDVETLKAKIFSRKISQEIGIRNNVTVKIVKEVSSYTMTCVLIQKENEELHDKHSIPISVLLNFISDKIFSIFLEFLFPTSHISVAERIAISIFSKELSLRRNVLVDKLLELKDNGKDNDPFDIINRRASRYPSPVRDSLEIAEDLNNFKKNTSEFSSFADEIEREILKGQIIISKEGEIQFKPEKAKSLKLPIHLSASVVKSLSNLVIYFRHLATTNDFIIIDEPELNLHPDNQVIIARLIAKIVNKGFKVLISTHSDYIVRELNNLIMLYHNDALSKKFNSSPDTLLDHKKVGAILFHYSSRKAVNLEVNETGFEVETIDNVINELNEKAQNLFFKSDSE